jgi:hypothetical protein
VKESKEQSGNERMPAFASIDTIFLIIKMNKDIDAIGRLKDLPAWKLPSIVAFDFRNLHSPAQRWVL